jgi:hypothetical protein
MRSVQLVMAASLAGGIAFAACSESETPSNPNKDPALVTTEAAISCIGADPMGDKGIYPQKRVFLESQGWWGARKTDGTVPKLGNAEHIHVGMCFPLQGTVSGQMRLIVRVLGHNLPVNSVIKVTSLHDPGGGSIPDINWNRKVLAADNGNVILWDTVDFNTTSLRNGLREFRNLTIVTRPDTDELHASSGWCWTISNSSGGTPAPSGTCEKTPASTMARGWYTCFQYKLAETRNWTYPYAGIARNTNYTLTIGARDGADSTNNDFTAWQIRLDPRLHAVPQDTGVLIAKGTGPAYGKSITIPGSRLTTGAHTLVIIGAVNGDCTSRQKGELSAVFAVPLKVN